MTRHHAALSAVNPCAPDHACDEALRCALTWLLTGDEVPPPVGTDAALRYVRDRVNVPRDMSVWAGRRLREALEATAQLAGNGKGPAISSQHRRDQDPAAFRRQQAA